MADLCGANVDKLKELIKTHAWMPKLDTAYKLNVLEKINDYWNKRHIMIC